MLWKIGTLFGPLTFGKGLQDDQDQNSLKKNKNKKNKTF